MWDKQTNYKKRYMPTQPMEDWGEQKWVTRDDYQLQIMQFFFLQNAVDPPAPPWF